MRKILISIAVLGLVLAAGSRAASAGGSSGSFGAGGQVNLFGVGGPTAAYDGGKWHADAFLGYADHRKNINTGRFVLGFGADFWFHVHQTAMSDFGVGGGLSFYHENNTPNNFNGFYIILGGQMRVFVVSNVALSATLGFGVATADDDGQLLANDITGDLGITYYFF